jgi:hypothetical protein
MRIAILLFLTVLPCAAQQGGRVLPRVRDTLDAYSWRYFGLVPEWKNVRRATLTPAENGVLLRAWSDGGEYTRELTWRQARLLSNFVAQYESIMREDDPAAERRGSLEEMLTPIQTGFLPLFRDGIAGLRRSGISEGRVVTTSSWNGETATGLLLYVLDSTLVLGTGEDFPNDSIGNRLLLVNLSRQRTVAVQGPMGFLPAFLYGGMLGFAYISVSTPGGTFGGGNPNNFTYFDPSQGIAFGIYGGALLGLPIAAACSSLPAKRALDLRPETRAAEGVDSVLCAGRMFASLPPPEIRALFSAPEQMRIDRNSPCRPVYSFDSAAWTAAEAGAASRIRKPRVSLGIDWGFHFYGSRWKAEWGYNPQSAVWAGLNLSLELPLDAIVTLPLNVSLRPHAGIGLTNAGMHQDYWAEYTNVDSRSFNFRAGVDIKAGVLPGISVFTGADYQSMHERFEYHSTYSFNNELRPTSFVDHLFVPIGVCLDWTSSSLDVQFRIGLGISLHTEPPPHAIYELRFPPSQDRGWDAVLVTYSRKL